ncbi:alpha/beta fold hydrolase [Umezawaea tangerina]|uniref:Pyruvate dehydrogenase E2 component (Dihydrolipoamide acetyltransferase)/N-formylmaleamate deformylase n=1 Tax=Umezawaea tangerina TaxID=84725 RepID=A0A2T0T177_9PSEU|nr:alpha/beta hydrolase [Umezawaea tangerina]PRY39428.1 pyruvate dehydrogenase E2 component (dihydrolipoamide acetyltransferase)/N-formylmaleamate deformylase [Umezawaea tangerina]
MGDELAKIAVNGVELGYRVHGAASGGPPLVFVHGYCMRSTSGSYEEVLELLAASRTVYALDFRGHGASPCDPADWTLAAVADDVVAFAHALGLDAPAYAGHSLGAQIGVFAEIRHPGTFSALCLLAPGPADTRRDPVDMLRFLVEHGHDRDAVREGFRGMFARPPGRMLELAVDAAVLVDSGVHRALSEQNSTHSVDDRLGEVAAPTLLVRGERDTVIAPERQHDLARKLRRCKEVAFSTEGHMLPQESPAMTAREILAFLDHDREPLVAATP